MPWKPITSSCWQACMVLAVLRSRVELTESTRVPIGARRISLGAQSSKRIRIRGDGFWLSFCYLNFHPPLCLSIVPPPLTDRSTVWEPEILLPEKQSVTPSQSASLYKLCTQRRSDNPSITASILTGFGGVVNLKHTFTSTALVFLRLIFSPFRRSQWPGGLRRGSAGVCSLGLRVRIPPEAWMYVSCGCYVLSARGFCVGLITRPEESYRVWCV
jgi:hypothetical protein